MHRRRTDLGGPRQAPAPGPAATLPGGGTADPTRTAPGARHQRAVLDRLRQRRLLDLLRARACRLLRAGADADRLPDHGRDLLSDRRHLRRGDRDVSRRPAAPRASPGTRSTSCGRSSPRGRRCSTTRSRSRSRRSSCRTTSAACSGRRCSTARATSCSGSASSGCCRSSTSSASRRPPGLNIVLAITDLATQLLLVVVGILLVLSPHVLVDNVHLGVAPTWKNFLVAIPVGMIAYTGIETISNMAEEARDETKTIPRAIKFVVRGRVRDLRGAADGRAVGAARSPSRPNGTYSDAARHERGRRRLRRRSRARDRQAPASRRAAVRRRDLRRASSRRRSCSSPPTRASSAPRGSSTRWACTGRCPIGSADCTRAFSTPWIGILLFGGDRLPDDHPRPGRIPRQHVRVRGDALVHDRARCR